MFVPESLVKARVVCSKKAAEGVVRALYDFGTIHVTVPKAFSPSKPLDSFKEVSEKLVRLRAVEKELSLQAKARQKEFELSELERKFLGLRLEEFDRLLCEKRSLLEKRGALLQRIELLKPLKGFKADAQSLARHSPRVVVKCVSLSSVDRLKGLKARFSFEYCDGFALLVFDWRDKAIVEEFVKKNNCVDVAIPLVSSHSFVAEFDLLSSQLKDVDALLKENSKAFLAYKKARGSEIVETRSALEVQALKAELPARFAESQMLVLVEGWVPKKAFSDLEKRLRKSVGAPVHVEQAVTSEIPPTKMNNPRPIKPFEFLVSNLSFPRFDEIDPTFLVFISFPLFFGMILGDVGYGVAMLVIAFLLRRSFKDGFFRAAAGMMFFSALWTIFFGFVFGEFLGMEHVLGYELHPFIARAEEHGLMLLMQLSILVGFLHVLLGFAIGVVSSLIGGHKKHAAAKLSWLVVSIALVGFLSAASDVSLLGMIKPVMALPAEFFLYALVAGLLGLIVFEGLNAVFELPGLISNFVSYLRIMAIGVSGVILASMINLIPLKFSLEPVALLSFLLFAVAFTVGHAFALVLGIFESSIQSLRLHYVEFFSKFFHGGGIPFTPLKQKRLE